MKKSVNHSVETKNVNPSNLQDKLRKLTTKIALATALLVGYNSCGKKQPTLEDKQEVKMEVMDTKQKNETGKNESNAMDTEVKNVANDTKNDQPEEFSDEWYEAFALSIAVDEESQRLDEESKQIAEDRKKIAEDRKKIAEDTENAMLSMERNREGVDEDLLAFSSDLQTSLDEYFAACRELGREPSAHCKKLMASRKK
ncbi:hypothetical protein BSK20_02585 [SR1 bacterium human oral taxon HOT-345]|nr:hypothetical protein BSK20_02585 [SR1 bacterium human oral taxon HOT-345]